MEKKRFIRDEGLVRFGKSFAKVLSHNGIHRLAKMIAGFINFVPKTKMHQAIKSNLAVVNEQALSAKELKSKSKEVIRNVWRAQADYFYYYQHPEEGKAKINYSEAILEAIADVKERRIPTLLCGPHFGNFDLFGLSMVWQGMPMMVLTVPNPDGLYSGQNAMRIESGIDVRPIDIRALRDARKFLLEGNCIVTGIDRPVEDPENAKYKPLFFERPAALPVFHTRFGLEKNVRVRVGYCLPQADGTFFVHCSEPIPMCQYDEITEEYEKNAQNALEWTEKIISKDPKKWLMLHSVWGIN